MQHNKLAVLLIGPPGSGKSSVAQKIKEIIDIAIVGTGNLLRIEMEKNTEEGKEIKKFLDNGQFVSTELVSKIVLKNIKRINKEIILFDGFPRIEEQIDSFFKICSIADLKLKAAIILEIARETSLKRLSGRRICKRCNEIYNIYYNPPPPGGKCKCGDKLETRDDDKPDVVGKRLDIYEKDTFPIIKYFKKKYPEKTFLISGEKTIEETAKEILTLIE